MKGTKSNMYIRIVIKNGTFYGCPLAIVIRVEKGMKYDSKVTS